MALDSADSSAASILAVVALGVVPEGLEQVIVCHVLSPFLCLTLIFYSFYDFYDLSI